MAHDPTGEREAAQAMPAMPSSVTVCGHRLSAETDQTGVDKASALTATMVAACPR